MSEENLRARVADALEPASFLQSLRFIGTLSAKPRWYWFLLFFVVNVLTVLAMVGTSNLLGFSLDLVNGGALPIIGSGSTAMAWLLAIVAIGILGETAGRSLLAYLINSRSRRLSVELRKSALSAALRAPVPEVMKLGTGNVISRITQDIDNTVRIISMVGVRLVITLLMLPASLIALVAIHWSFLPLFLLVVLALFPLVRRVVRLIPHATNVVSSTEARRNSLLLDTIRGMGTLRVLGLQDWALTRMRDASWTSVQASADRAPIFTRILALGSLAYGFLLVGVFGGGAYLSNQGILTVGAATAAVFLVIRMEIHVFNVLFFASEIQSAATSLGRAVSLALLVDQSSGSNGGDMPADIVDPPELRIENLSYAYPAGATVLNNLNLVLAPGTTTALVGTSGAGKSTLAGLIAGLQRPDSGAIYVAGSNTAEVSDTWTTKQVALISQEVHLFSGTLRDDLLMAAPQADDPTLFDALASVGLHQSSTAFSRWFPSGLETLIGAGAQELAPDVQQQISLARIVLRNPPVLIMDEATSEAGSDNARLLETAATQIAHGRTSLVVAHRLDQAVVADRIIVMEAGEIIEDGSHDQLIALGGRYAQLYARWSQRMS